MTPPPYSLAERTAQLGIIAFLLKRCGPIDLAVNKAGVPLKKSLEQTRSAGRWRFWVPQRRNLSPARFFPSTAE